MSRFGWAYVNGMMTGTVANGPTNSIQFNSGSNILSGSSNFTFDPSTNTVYLTGTLRADTLVVSASQILKSGSTIFGDSSGDTHQFTGSMFISNTLSASSTLSIGGNSTLGGPVTVNNGNLNVTAGGISGSGVFQIGGNSTIGGTLLVNGSTTLSGNTDIYAITQVRNSSFNMVSGSTIKSSFDINGNLSGSGQLQVGTDITLGNNLTMNGPLFTSAGEIRVKNQIIKTTDAAGTTTKAYLDQNGDISGSRDHYAGGDVIVANSYRGSGAIKGAYNSYNINFTIPKTAYFVGIDSSAGAVTASLQAANQYFAGQKIIIKDINGSAATGGKNIRIAPSGSEQIDGGGAITINNNFGSKTLICDGTSKFYIIASF
jgi:hypothetical protein